MAGRPPLLFGCVLLVALLAVPLVAGTPAGLTGSAASVSETPVHGTPGEEVDADRVEIAVELHDDGSATWSIEYRIPLTDEETAEAFDSIEADVEADPATFLEEFEARMTAMVDGSSEATGREMAAEDFTVRTDRQTLATEYGIVTYGFHWDGFAAVEDDELHAGDAIAGFFLDPDTQLVISWPEAYDRIDVSPEPDDERETAVIWSGQETEFVSGEPRLVVSSADSMLSGSILYGAVVAVVVLAGILWVVRNRLPTPTVGDGSEPDATPAKAENAPEQSAASTPTTETVSYDDSLDDPSLLSNEEQVLRLLQRNGGRMKQQQVVSELDWTDAKTSKAVSALRESGDVESFRLGRENVLKLAEADERELEGEHRG